MFKENPPNYFTIARFFLKFSPKGYDKLLLNIGSYDMRHYSTVKYITFDEAIILFRGIHDNTQFI